MQLSGGKYIQWRNLVWKTFSGYRKSFYFLQTLIFYAIYFTDNVFQMLKDGLGKIKVIDGSLIISRSFPIVSLDFFEDLEEIKGVYTPDVKEEEDVKRTKRKKYALELTENENLQVLFTDSEASKRNSKRSVKIRSQEGKEGDPEQGSAFIHYNPKLCKKEITNLLKSSGMKDPAPIDISYGTNGDKAICSTNKLNLTITTYGDSADLYFTNYQKYLYDKSVDTRQLLKYEINYIEVSEATYKAKNLTKFQGREACGGGDWKTRDEPPSDIETHQHGNAEWPQEQTFIRPLKPFTYYAVYVSTMIGKFSIVTIAD